MLETLFFFKLQFWCIIQQWFLQIEYYKTQNSEHHWLHFRDWEKQMEKWVQKHFIFWLLMTEMQFLSDKCVKWVNHLSLALEGQLSISQLQLIIFPFWHLKGQRSNCDADWISHYIKVSWHSGEDAKIPVPLDSEKTSPETQAAFSSIFIGKKNICTAFVKITYWMGKQYQNPLSCLFCFIWSSLTPHLTLCICLYISR